MRIIQVGVGGFGKSWRQSFTASSEIEVVALVDINRENLEEGAAFFDLPEEKCFADDELPWEEVEADAVVHSTPQNFRYRHTIRALRAGKHVAVVKPLSDGWETGVAMVEEARRCQCKLVVAQQMRWHPLILCRVWITTTWPRRFTGAWPPWTSSTWRSWWWT